MNLSLNTIRQFIFGTIDSRQQELEVDSEESLTVVLQNKSMTIDSDYWSIDSEEKKLFFTLHQNKHNPNANTLVRETVLESVHLPVTTDSAAENRWDKTESYAKMPIKILRYSVVQSRSKAPDSPHSFRPEIVEIWFDFV